MSDLYEFTTNMHAIVDRLKGARVTLCGDNSWSARYGWFQTQPAKSGKGWLYRHSLPDGTMSKWKKTTWRWLEVIRRGR